MGLDQYLRGEKFHWTDWEDDSKNPKEDGFKIVTKEIEIGYWRKHPNLHGFIVETFAEGKDECQRIELSIEELQKIISAVKDKILPETKGFFFGCSDGSEIDEDIKIFERAIAWASEKEERISRIVYYKASW